MSVKVYYEVLKEMPNIQTQLREVILGELCKQCCPFHYKNECMWREIGNQKDCSKVIQCPSKVVIVNMLELFESDK